MTLEQLRIFVAVAAREHLTRAAADLNLTQSAVSAAIAALEQRHATRLFNRVGRGIELTAAGRLFLAEARAVLARAAAAEALLDDLAGLRRGRLALAASQTVANYWLPPVLNRYRRLHPAIALELSIGNTESVVRSVLEGTADLGVVEGEVDEPALRAMPVAADDLVLVARPGLVPAGTVDPNLLRSLPFVWRERGSATRTIAFQALAALGLDPGGLEVFLELPSNEAVRSAVEDGAGLTVLSRHVVAGSLKAGTLIDLGLALPRRRFYALLHRERPPAPAPAALLALFSAL
ncbi:LysR family transcriptional regulator [Zavarzinia compransoris]|uniref:LysR family transcriptional regulator n=1 Tax=Zavarzinia compransoris TaxID=1264899 RepID=A0A317DWS7_9PROT|nr:LysR family transcriptional regulator [Zavarzinia compransoris]PWR18316.1 LysR family transcriptional regulator [Zavarzinia compransoris]TDP43627.1 DNA-binding transcriptional LysR family regulator [Zavarzinia compransoris]